MADNKFCEFRFPQAALTISAVGRAASVLLGLDEASVLRETEHNDNGVKVTTYGADRGTVLLNRPTPDPAEVLSLEEALTAAGQPFDAFIGNGDGFVMRWWRDYMPAVAETITNSVGDKMVPAFEVRGDIDGTISMRDPDEIRKTASQSVTAPSYETDAIENYARPASAGDSRLPSALGTGDGSLAF
ncbi:MAG: hypothetical protein RJQ08_11625 [Salinisphaeraceae bacterium]